MQPVAAALAAILLALVALKTPRMLYTVVALRQRRAYRVDDGEGRVDVSVIVPARQEPLALIKGLLHNVASQVCKPREVIIVWDYPSSGFEHVAREAWRLGERLGLRVRVVAKPWRGRGKASVLNFAVKLASGKYILVLDVDDRLVSRDAICKALSIAKEHRVAQLGIIGVAYMHPLQGPPAVAVHTGFKMVHEARYRLGLQPLLVGSGLLVEKRLAASLRFDEDAIVEDVDFAVRLAGLGVRPGLAPRLLAMAGAPGYRAFRRQQSRWSRGVAAILRRRWRLLASLGTRGAELAYMLVSYALEPLTTIAATVYGVAVLAGVAPPWPLKAYTLVMLADAMLAAPLSLDAPVARRARNAATAAAFAVALQPVLLVNWLRGLCGREGVFEVTPRRVSGRERPGRLETVYLALVGCVGALLVITGRVLEGLILLLHLAALTYLYLRLPMLTSSSQQHPQGPSRRRA